MKISKEKSLKCFPQMSLDDLKWLYMAVEKELKKRKPRDNDAECSSLGGFFASTWDKHHPGSTPYDSDF
jgi:hypothetical protein